MRPLKAIYVKQTLLCAFMFCGFAGSYAQNSTLYFSVKNVGEISKSTSATHTNSSLDTELIGDGSSESNTYKQDEYLVPFIVSQISLHTSYQNVVRWNNKDSRTSQAAFTLLQIAINRFNNDLEYQFQLIKTLNGKDSVLKISSFFINPDNPEYQNILTTQIQQLFEGNMGTNKKPVAKIRLDGMLVSPNKVIYRSNKDMVILDGTSSEDIETPKKYLKYRWEVRKLEDSVAFLADFKFEDAQQKLIISEPGTYTFSLSVSDGVTSSNEDCVIVRVIKKPSIDLYMSVFHRVSQRNLASRIEKNIFDIRDNIGFEVTDFDSKSNLVVKYLYSVDKTQKYFLRFHKKNYFEIHPGMQINALQMPPEIVSYDPFLKQKLDSTFDIILDTTQFGPTSSVQFRLGSKIHPGNHKYLVYTQYNGVTSNADTVTISYKEKSLFSLSAGYSNFGITKGGDFFNQLTLNLFRVGLRAYITQRLSTNLILILPTGFSNGNRKGQNVSANNLMGDLSYDILPWKIKNLHTGNFPMYLSGFMSYYQFLVSHPTRITAYSQLGLGLRPRVQLFANRPNLGVVNFEIEAGYYTWPAKSGYSTVALGFNLIYGFCNY